MPDTPLTPGVDVGAIIRLLRESRDLSAAELGQRIGKSEAMVTAIERGERRANMAVCRAVATALEAPLATIIGESTAAIIEAQPAKAAS